MGDEERKALQGGGPLGPALHPGQRIARLESALLDAVIPLEAAGAYVPSDGPDVWATAGKLREVIDGTGDETPRACDLRELELNLAAAEEQRDVYRDRCQQLSSRVSELTESLESARTALVLRDADHNQETAMLASELEQLRTLVHALQFATDKRLALTASLRTLAARIRREGGYSTSEDQEALREAETLVSG